MLDQLGLEKCLQNITIKVIMYKYNRNFIFVKDIVQKLLLLLYFIG
jgi:hypothetical protein